MLLGTPGKPRNESVDKVGETWVYMYWNHPSYFGSHGITRYIVTAINTQNNTLSSMSTNGNEREMNFTSLLPGVLYKFYVYSVSKTLHLITTSQTSEPFTATTLTFNSK